ncbi:MAG TPA: hypothetical protein VIC06_02945 [Solirubrobacteraceae bacterium]
MMARILPEAGSDLWKIITTAIFVALAGVSLCACGDTARETPQLPIVFDRDFTSVWLLHPNGPTQFLTMGSKPKWSPDHRRVIFLRSEVSASSANQNVWTSNVDGTGVRQVTHVVPPNQVRFIAFGGHPAVIAYADHDGIWTVRPDGSGAHEILRDGGDTNELAISPDGSTIAYAYNGSASAPAALKLVGIGGGAQRVAFPGTSHVCGVSYPSWSPDGRWLAFSLCVDKGGGEGGEGIWLVRPNGRDLHRLVLAGASPTWSPDGKWIAFNLFHENAQRNGELSAFVKIHPDGRGLVELTPYASEDNPAPGQPLASQDPDW